MTEASGNAASKAGSATQPNTPTAKPKLPGTGSLAGTYMWGLPPGGGLVMWQGDSGERQWVVAGASQVEAARKLLETAHASVMKDAGPGYTSRYGRNVHEIIVLQRVKRGKLVVQIRGKMGTQTQVPYRERLTEGQSELLRAVWCSAQRRLVDITAVKTAREEARAKAAKASEAAAPKAK